MNKITYLNDSQLGEWDVSPVPPKHHLEIGDILMVKVISRNEESNDLFNIENKTNSANPTLTAANLYLNGFTISQEGTIDIPRSIKPIPLSTFVFVSFIKSKLRKSDDCT